MVRVAHFHSLLYTSLEFLIKFLLIKKIHPSLRGPRKEAAPMFPKMGPYGNRGPVVVPYVNTLGTRCG